MKRSISFLATCLVGVTLSGAALAGSTHVEHPKREHWKFDGMFGTVDRQAAQRGFQVYKEVCAACHGLSRVAFRNLQALGFSEAEVKELAAGSTVKDGPNDMGEMFDRPGTPSDHFVPPYPNEKASRANNNGAYPPDLSLMVKARPDGANYMYSILTGYEEPKGDVVVGPNMHYNPYFPGGQIAMPAPLADGQVAYQDGTEASVKQMSQDVVNFLQWAAEPEMEHRKQMGIRVLLFLAIMTSFFYIAKKRVWRNVDSVHSPDNSGK